MGKHKRRKRARSTSSETGSSRTPSPRPPGKRKKVSDKNEPEIVSTSNIQLHNIIPEFDPLTDNVVSWLNVIESYSTTFSWNDGMIRYQALNKLKGSAKIWYDSMLRHDCTWTQWLWHDWKQKILTSFQVKRNMFELLKQIITKKPTENESLYSFFFEQKSKIDALNLNFTEYDITSIILGNIGDDNISASVEASNFQTCDSLAAFLHSRVYKPVPKVVKPGFSGQSVSRDTNINPKIVPPMQTSVPNQTVTPSSNKTSGPSLNRKPIECYGCGGNHKRVQCPIRCSFCGKRGHTENVCFNKKSAKIEQDSSFNKQEAKCIRTSSSVDKFHKNICINQFIHEAFIDTGSSCSIISKRLAMEYSLPITILDVPITLQGFSNDNIKTVTSTVKTKIQIDSVVIEDVEMYVLNDLSGCDILIGRNVTERNNLMYTRVGNTLTFSYAQSFYNFCNVIREMDFEFDAESHQDELAALFTKYRECIASNIKELGKVNNHEMVIDLNDTKPVYCRPYRTSQSDRQIIREMVEELIENGIIRESHSAYASPALLVNKKNGEKRLCIDYRALNKITIKDKYPMPRIEDLIDRLHGCKYFTSLDLKSGYYQIKMSEDSIHKTAFITEDGHYEFLRLPFGLANAPSCFQRMMNKVVGNHRFGKIILYLDDVLISSETIHENLHLLEKILKIFLENGLTINLKKCHFFKTDLEFLGYHIKEGCVMPNETKVEAVKDFPVPKTAHQLRQFIGLISYFRKFIKNCALLTSPLTKLLKKDTPWTWNAEHEKAFHLLKAKLSSDSILSIYDPNKENILYTDASREGIAGIMMQVTEEGEKPVHYYSRQTTEDEKKFHSFELELLAIVASLQKFRLYLLGSNFKIVTDCNAVRFALTKKEIIPRIARWVLSTQEFNFDIVHREGTRMQHVDALSRNPLQSGEKSESEIVLSISEADWLNSVQHQDEKLLQIKQILESGDLSNHKDIFNKYELLGNKVYRRTSQGRRWVVPRKCVWQVIKSNHDDLGHFALDKTIERISHLYWFPKMRRIVTKYIKNCLNCIYFKNKGGAKEGELYPLPKYAQPFHTLHVDHLGPFVETIKKNKYLLVVVDSFTKFVFITAVKKANSTGVINEMDNISKTFGNPRRIIADAGSAFTSHAFREYCSNKNIRLHTVATGMPRSNGQVERFNKTILEAMRTMGADLTEDRWDQCTKPLQQALNSTFHKTIKAVPSEVLLGYRLKTDSDVIAPQSDENHVVDVTQLRAKVDENIKTDSETQKQRFDKSRTKAKKYREGDLVLVKIPSQTNDGQSRKLLPVFKGPFQIKKVLGNDRYEISDLRGSERSARKYTGQTAAENMKPWININHWDLDDIQY